VRTTVDIGDDVLQAARELARRGRRTIGEVLTELARRGLAAPAEADAVAEPKAVYGFQPFARRGGIVTNDLIDRLRDDEAC
jgi:hypothetical protein